MCTKLCTIMGDDMDADAARAHVHGFHAYPARMHPTLARRCVELLAPASGVVLDPFCGSGTSLVEARLAGRGAYGVDLNPLAVLLATLKTRGASDHELRALTTAAVRVARHAEDRRRYKRGATRRYPQDDIRLFDPHVLLELDGLRDGLQNERAGFAQDALRLVLSSILVKVSRKPGDTSDRDMAPRRLATGFTIRLFESKAQELVRRLASFRSHLPPHPPPVRIHQGDARQLRDIPDQSVDLVLTSPPYAGTYDYVEHHRDRLRWLDLPVEKMNAEIGARRNLERLDYAKAVERFGNEMSEVLQALRRVLRDPGFAVIVIADSVVARQPVWADELVRSSALASGLCWLATGSQPRPHFHGGSRKAFASAPRREHTIVLASGA